MGNKNTIKLSLLFAGRPPQQRRSQLKTTLMISYLFHLKPANQKDVLLNAKSVNVLRGWLDYIKQA
jgi:hypothetical protein